MAVLNRLQNLLASASDEANSTSSSREVVGPNVFDSHPLDEFHRVGEKSVIVSNPLRRNIIPDGNSTVNIGSINKRINKVYADEIYIKTNGIKFLDNSKSAYQEVGNVAEKSQISYSNSDNETKILVNESSSSFSTASVDMINNAVNEEHFIVYVPSSSVGYGTLSSGTGVIRTATSTIRKYTFRFITSSLTSSAGVHGYSTSPSGSNITIQSQTFGSGGSVSKFAQAFNQFRIDSSSLFPFTASIHSSSRTPFSESVFRVTSTVSGERLFKFQNFVSHSEATDTGSLSRLSSSIGYLGETMITGSNLTTTDLIIAGGTPLNQAGKVTFKAKLHGGGEKNLLRLSASAEDIVQFGEESQENRFWKFKKDGRIIYSPSNSTDTFELNVSESLEFAKRENFGAGTKTSFSKTKGDTDESKRVTDVTNIRLPYNKGITLVNKAGVDTIGGFGITTTDLSSSRGDSNVENVIRFKGAGGYSFQNAIGNPSFHIDRFGNAAFGSVGIVGDHWDASANFHVTGSKLANIFRVSTDTDVLNIKNNELAISGSLSVSGSIQGNMTTMTNHAYFDSSTNERNWLPFTPFGTSETNMWTSSRDNTHRFIAPHDGRLKRVMIRNNHAATASMGNTTIALTIFPQLTGSEEVTNSVGFNTGVDFNFVTSSFSKGDLLGVYVQPSGSPKYVNVTCVWEYDTRT